MTNGVNGLFLIAYMVYTWQCFTWLNGLYELYGLLNTGSGYAGFIICCVNN